MNPKTDPAFPGQRDYFMSPDGTLKRAIDYGDVPQGLSQYAEIAARFHAALKNEWLKRARELGAVPSW